MDFHLILKAISGAVVIPIAISAHRAWPWWTAQQSLRIRIISGIFILPLVFVASKVTPWWESF